MPSIDPKAPITHLLNRWGNGDKTALEPLMQLVYQYLALIARNSVRGEKDKSTYSTGDLLNDAYLNLFDDYKGNYENRYHFFNTVGKVMRNILINRAKRKKRVIHGGGFERVLMDNYQLCSKSPEYLESIDEAMQKLSLKDPLISTIIELRFFGGCTVEETAKLVRKSPSTIKRKASFGMAWLSKHL